MPSTFRSRVASAPIAGDVATGRWVDAASEAPLRDERSVDVPWSTRKIPQPKRVAREHVYRKIATPTDTRGRMVATESSKCLSGRVRGRATVLRPSGLGRKSPRAFGNDERMAGEHDAHVMLPAPVRTAFEVGESKLALHVLVGALDAPALLHEAHEALTIVFSSSVQSRLPTQGARAWTLALIPVGYPEARRTAETRGPTAHLRRPAVVGAAFRDPMERRWGSVWSS